MKLKNKITGYFLIICLVVVLPLVIFYTRMYHQAAKEEHILNANSFNQKSSLLISSYFQEFLEKARTVSNMYAVLDSYPEKMHKEIITGIEKNILLENKEAAAFWYNRQIKTFDTSWTMDYGRYEIKYYRAGNELIFKETYTDKDVEGEEYKSIRQRNTEVIYTPYIGSYTGNKSDENMYINIAVPIKQNGSFIGLIGMDFTLDKIADFLNKIKPYKESFSLLLHSSGNFIYHPDSTYNTKNFMEYFKNCRIDTGFIAAFRSEKEYKGDFIDENGEKYYCSFLPIKPAKSTDFLYFGTFIPYDLILSKSRTVLTYTIIFGLIGILLIYFVIYLVSSQIVNPINEAVEIASVIGRGDLTKNIQIKSQDEIGKLSKALSIMTIDLTGIINQIKERSLNLISIGKEEKDKSGKLRDSSMELASSAEEVSASLNLMNQSIISVTSNLGSINEKSKTIELSLNFSQELVNQTNSSMFHIDEKVKTINSIAKQTNLLALNAAIEAARAGHYGRGFAIVANEVRNLSLNTTTAANEIEQAIVKGMEISNQSELTVKELAIQLNEILQGVNEISIMGYEIKESISQIEIAINSLNNISQQNTLISDTLAENSGTLMKSVDELNKMINKFKTS